MNKFLFFSCNIQRFGGAQSYYLNKAISLKKEGYEVMFFYSGIKEKEWGFERFKDFSCFAIPMFQFFPSSYSESTVKRVLEYIKHKVSKSDKDDVIIESNYPMEAVWGETVAKAIQAKHFVFVISEKYDGINWKSALPLFSFKYDRGEIAGNNARTLHDLFEGTMNVSIDEKYHLVPDELYPIQDVNYDLIEDLKKFDYIITYFGRNKGYVSNIFSGVKQFSKSHESSEICFIVIGDISQNDELYNGFNDQRNLSVIKTGILYPVPRKLFVISDVVIAGSGCAYYAYQENAMVIVADAKDFLSGGVLGYDTFDSLYTDREKNPAKGFNESLEDVLIERKYDGIKRRELDVTPQELGTASFDRFFDYLKRSSSEKDYYNYNRIYEIIDDSLERRLKRYDKCCTVLGVNLFMVLMHLWTKN